MSIDVARVRTERPLSEQVAEEIRVVMTRRRISGRHLASALGVSQTWVSSRLAGGTPIDLNDLQRIAGALNTPVAALLPPSINDGLLRPAKRGMRSKLHARPRPGMTRISASGTGVPATIRRPVPVAYRSDEAVA